MVPENRRIGLLFGRYVITAEGATVGRIHDVRLRADGPILAGFGPALRIEGVIVRPESIASRLGFDRPDMDGPWPLSALGKRAARRALVVPWETMNLDEHVIVTTRAHAALEPAFP